MFDLRILIDLQGAQGSSRNRGIGRYALALALGIARNKGAHDVFIALSDLFPQTIAPLRAVFHGVLPEENIRVWSALANVAESDSSNATRRANSEALREALFVSLRPDMVVVTSLFEGLGDNCITSVNKYATLTTAVVLYDLIPLIYKETYLERPEIASWYKGKLEQLKGAELLLAISNSARREAIDLLGFNPARTINISSAADLQFQPRPVSQRDMNHLRDCYGLKRRFVMYTGGIDLRKNIDGLIRAYARLPKILREAYQLTIVCSIRPEEREKLERIAAEAEMAPDELVMTGYVPEHDLLTLYNACTFFIMPSLHEGFGLPALEAMQCGKAVIASNTSSFPEVVGRPDALFDPRDELAIAAKLKQGLVDDEFRTELERHGPVQAARFSWDATAQRAIAAIVSVVERRAAAAFPFRSPERKRLAYVSPLPPERSGISTYSAELLPFLNEWYEIDVIVDQSGVTRNGILETCERRDIGWFRVHFREYDRILYHFGNSAIHQHMFDLLQEAPGAVVLHDFFISHATAHRGKDILLRALKESHGYHAVLEHFTSPSADGAIWKYPANLSILQNANGVIVHSEHSRRLADQWYGEGSSSGWIVIPHLRASSPTDSKQREEARKRIGFPAGALLLCSFGLLGRNKFNDRVVSAFLRSKLSNDPGVYLVFVGENDPGEYGQELLGAIRRSGLKERVRITGWADGETFGAYLRAADVAIQLRGLSRGETSGTVLDCMSHGLATVVNANGAFADIDRDAVLMLDDCFEDEELTAALERLADDHTLRQAIGANAQEIVRSFHSPARCAARYAEAIEIFHSRDANGLGGLISKLSAEKPEIGDAQVLASVLSRNFPPRPRPRQLLVDVSELVQRDSKTGIQRVVRSILRAWLTNPPPGWSVEPVFATEGRRGYRYARRFTCNFLEIDDAWTDDPAVDAWSGEVFVGLDLQPKIVFEQQEVLKAWNRIGVDIRFIIYDLLPVLRPDCFPDGSWAEHAKWLECISQHNGAICISKSVANELREWIAAHAAPRDLPFVIDWFHLGGNIMNSHPEVGLPGNTASTLRKLRAAPTFLMVGTIEPRKGHRQTLAAFETLWAQGVPANLVIVGKQGWHVDDLVQRLRVHPELGAQLHWLESVSDEYLETIYAASSCLIAASEGEGFGLPLIEAAQHHLPIIARDLPVFREIAGAHAFYFNGLKPSDLADALSVWLMLYRDKKHVRSDGMTWLTWAQSAQMLLRRLGVLPEAAAACRPKLETIEMQ